MKDDISRLNYSAAVLDSIPKMEKNLLRAGMSDDVESIKAWGSMIQRSRKFVLPPKGHFFSHGKGLRDGIYPQRMPFPLISLEVPYPGDVQRGRKCGKRHILCQEALLVESRGGFQVFNETSDPNGFFVIIFAYVDDLREWSPQPCAAFVRYDTPTGAPGTGTFPGEGYQDQATFPFMRVPLLNQIWAQVVLLHGLVEADKAFASDTAEEVRIAFEFLQVLACRNVRQAEHAPPERLNASRVRSGKFPIDKFYTLKIGDVIIGQHHDGYQFSGAFKVREHYRSGHIRRLPDHNIWVTDTIVALGSSEGRVVKRYAVPANE